MPRARLLLVDDHPVVISGLVRLLSQQPELECCGEASSAHDALSLARKLKPDIAIIDLRLKQGDGLELIKALHSELPAIRLLVLSQHTEPVYIERALRAGALGYVSKEQDPADLLTAIRTILAGQIYLTRGLAAELLEQFIGQSRTPALPGIHQLTDRELMILDLLGSGKTTQEIAANLGISPKTVESHRENLKRKLQLPNSAKLIAFAAQWAAQPVNLPPQTFAPSPEP